MTGSTPARPVVVVAGAREATPPPGLTTTHGDAAQWRFAPGPGDLAAALPGARALLLWDFRSRDLADAWHAADALEWVHVAGAGVDAAMFDDLARSEVVLTNSRGVFDEPMAEYVLGLVLAFTKDLVTTLRAQSERRWHHRDTQRLAGTRMLVVGAGPIGRAIARLARRAGLVVRGVARTPRSADPDFDEVVGVGDLCAALPWADVVVLAVPLTPDTERLVGAAELACMRPDARLINVARGRVVDEVALIEALTSGAIGGAALDVFEHEPLPADSPLWSLEQVIVSPHMSGDVVGWHAALVEAFVANLDRWRVGETLHNVVDKQRGYVTTGAGRG